MQDSFEPQSSDTDSALPAPYNSPWRALGQDLRAVGADLRLRGQELWRRNREGDLSVPAFWPEPFAAWFWPALLGFSLAVLILGGLQLRQVLQGQVPASSPDVERVRTTPFPETRPLPNTTSLKPDLNNQTGEVAPTLPNATRSEGPEGLERVEAVPAQSEKDLPSPSGTTEINQLRVDPLLNLLAKESSADGSQGEGLILSAHPQPDQNAVILHIESAAWMQRSPEQRQQLAQSWWTQLEDQGYADLRLVNEQEDLLARPARIGGGMIVFDPERV